MAERIDPGAWEASIGKLGTILEATKPEFCQKVRRLIAEANEGVREGLPVPSGFEVFIRPRKKPAQPKKPKRPNLGRRCKELESLFSTSVIVRVPKGYSLLGQIKVNMPGRPRGAPYKIVVGPSPPVSTLTGRHCKGCGCPLDEATDGCGLCLSRHYQRHRKARVDAEAQRALDF